MRMYDIIQKKKEGKEWTPEEIRFFVSGYTGGEIPDYQAAALCMAVWFRGMSPAETAHLTEAMMHSGDVLDLSALGDLSADKHSTGGVGDKTSLIVAPTVAALGGKMAKMSGRGLGHTGGTIDKLESIPGFCTSLSGEDFMRISRTVGVCIVGQSAALAPADKKLYALRDVTATVDSIPLIASSIMSKKLAAGAHNIVLDVKCGSGAFMKTHADAEALARAMIDAGRAHGRNVRALVSNMDIPLGNAVGNAVEVIEAIDVLCGRRRGDIYDICVELAANIIAMVRHLDLAAARDAVRTCIDGGAAFAKMKEWIAAQGGDVRAIEDTARLPHAAYRFDVVAPTDGYLAAMNTEQIGTTAALLGAGRTKKDDVIDPAAGLIVHRKTGDRVRAGEPLATLLASDAALFDRAAECYLAALSWNDAAVPHPPLLFGTLE